MLAGGAEAVGGSWHRDPGIVHGDRAHRVASGIAPQLLPTARPRNRPALPCQAPLVCVQLHLDAGPSLSLVTRGCRALVRIPRKLTVSCRPHPNLGDRAELRRSPRAARQPPSAGWPTAGSWPAAAAFSGGRSRSGGHVRAHDGASSGDGSVGDGGGSDDGGSHDDGGGSARSAHARGRQGGMFGARRRCKARQHLQARVLPCPWLQCPSCTG